MEEHYQLLKSIVIEGSEAIKNSLTLLADSDATTTSTVSIESLTDNASTLTLDNASLNLSNITKSNFTNYLYQESPLDLDKAQSAFSITPADSTGFFSEKLYFNLEITKDMTKGFMDSLLINGKEVSFDESFINGNSIVLTLEDGSTFQTTTMDITRLHADYMVKVLDTIHNLLISSIQDNEIEHMLEDLLRTSSKQIKLGFNTDVPFELDFLYKFASQDFLNNLLNEKWFTQYFDETPVKNALNDLDQTPQPALPDFAIPGSDSWDPTLNNDISEAPRQKHWVNPLFIFTKDMVAIATETELQNHFDLTQNFIKLYNPAISLADAELTINEIPPQYNPFRDTSAPEFTKIIKINDSFIANQTALDGQLLIETNDGTFIKADTNLSSTDIINKAMDIHQKSILTWVSGFSDKESILDTIQKLSQDYPDNKLAIKYLLTSDHISVADIDSLSSSNTDPFHSFGDKEIAEIKDLKYAEYNVLEQLKHWTIDTNPVLPAFLFGTSLSLFTLHDSLKEANCP